MMTNKVIIFSAPSGSGKTTIVQHLLKELPSLKFSISATSRAPRGEEKNGTDYHFLTAEEFKSAIEAHKFVEWEEVYAGTYYGTLKSEVQRIWNDNGTVIFDVDVVGGVKIKEIYGAQALSLFIMPPSIEELRKRLTHRATDSEEAIEKRIAKAQSEIEYAPKFDKIIINDSLEVALRETQDTIVEFLK